MSFKPTISPQQASQKIKNWCAYQERSQQETRRKLLDYGLELHEAEEIVSQLISENYLNEERFAMALAGGKFRIKHWGRNKIKMELKKHGVSEYLVKKALQGFDETIYLSVMEKVIEKKIKMVKGVNRTKIFYSVLNYVVSKGFESNIASDKINEMLAQE